MDSQNAAIRRFPDAQRGNHQQPADQDTLTRRYTEEAIRFISEHRTGPFFLPRTMPRPAACVKYFAGRSQGIVRRRSGRDRLEHRRNFGRIEETGAGGEYAGHLHQRQRPWLSQGENGGSAGKLRLGKGSTFEGGFREPCLMRWPGTIRAGSVYEGQAGTLDLFPTLLALAGGELPDGRAYDGCDIRPVLLGEGDRPEKDFFYFNGQDLQACRHGCWKAKKPFKGNIYGEPLEHPWLLFDLERDPGETTNLAEQYPAILASLQMKMKEFRKQGRCPRRRSDGAAKVTLLWCRHLVCKNIVAGGRLHYNFLDLRYRGDDIPS